MPQHPLADTGSMALDDSDREDNKAAIRFKLPRGAPQWQRRSDCAAVDLPWTACQPTGLHSCLCTCMPSCSSAALHPVSVCRLASFLQRDCQAPDVVLSLLFSARLWIWLGIIAIWCSLAKAAHRCGQVSSLPWMLTAPCHASMIVRFPMQVWVGASVYSRNSAGNHALQPGQAQTGPGQCLQHIQ